MNVLGKSDSLNRKAKRQKGKQEERDTKRER